MFTDQELKWLEDFKALTYVNPFSPERTEVERKLLGKHHKTLYVSWHSVNGELSVNQNLSAIFKLCGQLIERGLSGCAAECNEEQLDNWDKLSLYWLFAKYSGDMCRNVYLGAGAEAETARIFDRFESDFNHVMHFPGRAVPTHFEAEKIFALFHQIHRAFNYIFDYIGGGSPAAAGLRAAVWQSIFTCDLWRYHRQMFDKMNQITTLISGESGTGKELVAQAIAFSQFIPFDPKSRQFKEAYSNCFHPVLLSAMPQSLVESELFGYTRGAFTGAMDDRQGYFETCQECGSIFLDEIGDVCLETQVKLLRLLQTRQFSRIGDTATYSFRGKVIAASNADLSLACEQGTFRKDLLFRLCSDTIQTAPLRTMINGKEEELRQFILILAKRILEGQEVVPFADQCQEWIIRNLGLNYSWPGNVRELEQCLRNLLIRGDYTPLSLAAPRETASDAWFQQCRLTADEVLNRYVTAVYRREGSLTAAAAVTGLDRRTVRKYLQGV